MKHKLAVIGSGPAGCSAAIYAARSGIETTIFTGKLRGGQVATTTFIENYPGLSSISGQELSDNLIEHARSQSVIIIESEISKIEKLPNKSFNCYNSNGGEDQFDAIIIATGSNPKWLGIEGEERLMGRGISSCATCDGYFFKNKNVVVVGGGNTAATDCLYLANLAKSVTLVHRKDKMRAEYTLIEQMKNLGNLKFIWNSIVTKIIGANKLESVEIKTLETGQKILLPTDGLFIAIGHNPNTAFLGSLLALNDDGHINIHRGATGTSVEGIFAAGDVMDTKWKQAVTAAAFGSMAATEALEYLNSLKLVIDL